MELAAGETAHLGIYMPTSLAGGNIYGGWFDFMDSTVTAPADGGAVIALSDSMYPHGFRETIAPAGGFPANLVGFPTLPDVPDTNAWRKGYRRRD